uniref:Uncharacterized protein n=1 Tax=Arundo donax TaxID=35708 RepID=A0A0A9APA7_ARUDO
MLDFLVMPRLIYSKYLLLQTSTMP